MMSEQVKILFGGDVAQTGRTVDFLESGDFKCLWGNSKKLLTSHDYTICNLESPVVEQESAIEKVGPALKADKRIVEFLREWGVDAVSLANNHIMDQGPEGLKTTIKACENIGVDFFGVGRDINEARDNIQRVEIKGARISIVGVAESEFSVATEKEPGCATMCPIDLYNTIVREVHVANHVIVFFHGGVEMYELPRPGLQKICQYLVDLGASAVIGSHSHVPCGYEIYNGAPIFYGIGNLLFDDEQESNPGVGADDDRWHQGFFVSLGLGSDVTFDIIPYRQSEPHLSGIHILENEEREKAISELTELSSITMGREKVHARWMDFTHYKQYAVAPFFRISKNRIFNKLIWILSKKAWFPGEIWVSNVLNKIRCESHRERLIACMEQLYRENRK